MPPERVVAVGLGSEKPLASNKSSEGRAVNRRIDIVIKE
jgi:OOP family OmpA-OmpF porin